MLDEILIFDIPFKYKDMLYSYIIAVIYMIISVIYMVLSDAVYPGFGLDNPITYVMGVLMLVLIGLSYLAGDGVNRLKRRIRYYKI